MKRPPLGRLGAFLVAFVLGLTLILGRLAFLQVRDQGQYTALGQDQRVRTLPIPAPRGAILDRNGRDLALSVDTKDVYADPAYVTDPALAGVRLATLLGMRPAELTRTLSSDAPFVYVARHVDRATADQIAALQLPGIGFLDSSARSYPSGEYGAPQVLGYVDIDGKGIAGLESYYDDLLTGIPGERHVEVDTHGVAIPQGVNDTTPAKPGIDVVTTIDSQLQYQAQVALRNAVKTEHAKSGMLVAMDPHTGQVLAMASYPWFDPNNPLAVSRLAQDHPDRLANPVVQATYEPGSVNKVITMSAAIEEGVIGLRDVHHVPDSIQAPDDYVIHDAESHPTERMYPGDIITRSSNVGTIQIALQLGKDKLATYLGKYGFGTPTGVGFPYESSGIVPHVWDANEWSGVSIYNIPIGHGVAVTPLQMATVYATVANDGVWVEPSLMKGTSDATGTFTPATPPVQRRVISKSTADTVTGMLANVVASDEGTGNLAQIPGYWVAGKTGTAQKPRTDGKPGYTNRYVASFIGFLPAGDPKIVVAAILDEPASEFGGLASAPLFQRFGRFAIARMRIPTAPKPDLPPLVKK